MTTPPLLTAHDIRAAIVSLANPRQADILQRFFQTAPGQYAEGDRFLGVRSPQTRSVVRAAFKQNPDLSYADIKQLITDPLHEVRFAGFLYLVERYTLIRRKHLPGGEELISFYLQECHHGNNWDLVDCICPKILGEWLVLDSVSDTTKWQVMDSLAESHNLWRQRISMVATWTTLRHGRPDFTLRYAERHLHHPHPLIHKAVGWMLRELGKRVSLDLLRSFLSEHAAHMPRTALRYAIERMDEAERREWMSAK